MAVDVSGSEKDNTGFGRLNYGEKKSIVQSKNDINSGETSSVNKVLASGKDPFHGLSEPFAKRIQAFNDRIDMRREARAKRLDRPGSDRITSKYVSRTEQGEIDTPQFGKLDEKNLKLENKLNEKFGFNRIPPPELKQTEEPTSDDLQKKLGPNTWKSLDKKNLQAVMSRNSKTPTVTPGPNAINSSVKVNQATSGVPTGTVVFKGQSYPNQAAVDAQIKADNDNETRNLGGSSKDSTADDDKMLKIKQASPSSSPEEVRKILEASRGVENESIEDIVASYKRTRKFQ